MQWAENIVLIVLWAIWLRKKYLCNTMEHLSEWRNLRSITSNLSCNYTAAVTPLKWRLCQHSYYIRNPVFKGWWVICKKHFSLNNCSGCSKATSRYWPCHSRMWSCHVFCNMPWLNLAIYFANECIFSELGNYLEGLGFVHFYYCQNINYGWGRNPGWVTCSLTRIITGEMRLSQNL